MGNIIWSILSVLGSVVVTIVAARHYYRRTVQKELTPFIQFQSNVLAYINEDVKSDLHIEYKGLKIDNLQQIQIVIANTGERAIRDLLKPLTLDFPKDVEVLEGSILHIFPKGRDVTMNIIRSRQSVEFIFPLLNKDDFFILKLLVKGTPGREDLKFSIVGDDLPPELVVRRLTYDQLEPEGNSRKSSVQYGLFSLSILFLLLSSPVFILAHYIQPESLPQFESTDLAWLNSIPFIAIASAVGYVIGGGIFIVGVLLFFAAISESFHFPSKGRKFSVPRKFGSISVDSEGFDDLEAESTELAELYHTRKELRKRKKLDDL